MSQDSAPRVTRYWTVREACTGPGRLLPCSVASYWNYLRLGLLPAPDYLGHKAILSEEYISSAQQQFRSGTFNPHKIDRSNKPVEQRRAGRRKRRRRERESAEAAQ
jgi:hypothetical protein